MTQGLGLAVLAAIVTLFTWSSAFPVIHIGLRAFDPLPLAALRFAIAALCALLWLAWKRPPLPQKGSMIRLVLCALSGVSIYQALLNTGQVTVSAAASCFIVNIAPIMTVVLSVLFLGERFTKWAWVGLFISFAGVSVIAMTQPGGWVLGSGTSLVLAATLSCAIFFTLQRPLVLQYGALTCTAWLLLLGAFFLLPWLPQAFSQAAEAPAESLWAALYLGVFPSAIGYATWSIAQGYFGSSRAANLLYLAAPLAAVFSFLLIDEVLSIMTLLGGAIALMGVALVNTWGRS